ncbi:BadF/BadG/BcrA/BcrD ATPase family protein [Pseudolactococcus yaeyamensis]
MAGIDISNKSKEMKAVLEREFPRFQQVKIMNDGYLGMIAALKGRDGIFVISGTGSVVYGRKQNQLRRVGGYGHLLGDEGSAYWIGHELFKGLTTFIDDNEFDSPFYQAFLSSEGVAKVDAYQLIKKFYTLSKEEVAQYALWVSQFAENGDEEAIKILEDAGILLAKQVKVVMKNLKFTIKPLLTFAGSVLTKNTVVLEALSNYLTDVILLKEKVEPTKAAYYYWTKESD